jgi:phage shock protein E
MISFLKKLFGMNSNDELEKIIQEGAFLVDVREPGEVASGGVEGSVNIPLGSVANQLDRFKDKEHIVVFCRSGLRSRQAKGILEQNGFTNVFNGGTWKDVKAMK